MAQQVAEILSVPPTPVDVIMLQEVDEATRAAVSMRFHKTHQIVNGEGFDPIKGQNSIVLLAYAAMEGSAVEVTRRVVQTMNDMGCDVGCVSGGDLVVVELVLKSSQKAVAVSYHGSSSGDGAARVLQALDRLYTGTDAVLIVGVDANTAWDEDAAAEGRLGVAEFLGEAVSCGLRSSFGTMGADAVPTSFKARTYLQPQLHKSESLATVRAGDRRLKQPRDFLLYSASTMDVSEAGRVNCPEWVHKRNCLLATATFPSDHSLLHAIFVY